MSDCALIVFVRNPELGKVKTRLAKTMGDEQALDIYKKLVNRTQTESESVSADRLVYYSNEIMTNDGWNHAVKRRQSEGDLGRKMSKAIQEAFVSYDRICIIGSDCPDLTSEVMQKAFDLLETSDFVLGPADDGGYYLLGMRIYYGELFEDMTWSHDQVLNHTIDRISTLKKDFVLLPELIDVDTEEDWKKVMDIFD